ncbi:hypothetical protein RM155_05895 [Pantoea agglomerans]|uniref:hypothetical protein n=1 Tax=Enterobacter agglomerans TaxID=549 RepID=UPI002897DD64|nr:hypothetical protein [Pantoea agglomerans]WNK72546.1 hypothetical protein RM155_05895 [Pantoea agglomerans]
MENKNIVKIEGVIGDKKITGSLSVTGIDADALGSKPSKQPLPLKKIIFSYLVPFLILTIAFIADKFLINKYQFILFIAIPIAYGILFYNIVTLSSAENFNYLKKLKDLMTLLSSFIAAVLILLKIFSLDSSIVDYVIKLLKNKPLVNDYPFLFYLESAILFMLLQSFAAFSTIKLLFAFKDFKDARIEVKKAKN